MSLHPNAKVQLSPCKKKIAPVWLKLVVSHDRLTAPAATAAVAAAAGALQESRVALHLLT